jgi:MoxR-like ATPase
LQEFFKQRKTHQERDLLFQRVFLLHGPPGCGKTSFLQALAVEFSLPFYFLSFEKTTDR